MRLRSAPWDRQQRASHSGSMYGAVVEEARVTAASEDVRREWHRRRAAALLPMGLLTLALVLRAASDGDLWIVPLGLVIVLAPIVGVLVWRDARFRHAAAPGV